MNEVVLVVRLEGILSGEFVQRRVDLLEVPRVAPLAAVKPYFGFRRDGGDVFSHALGELLETALVEDFKTVHQKILVLADGYGGSPSLPARRAVSRVERRSSSPSATVLFRATLIISCIEHKIINFDIFPVCCWASRFPWD